MMIIHVVIAVEEIAEVHLGPFEGVVGQLCTRNHVGDKVKSGDLLCYIEAMKTYNAIRADFDGTVVAICVNPGDSVSEDDVLMKIG